MSTSDDKEALVSAMTADTMGYPWVLHRRLADALKLSIWGLNKLCALIRLLISTHDIDGDTNLDKPPIIANRLEFFDSVVLKLVCFRIKSVYILKFTNTNEISWNWDGEFSLYSRDAHVVEIGVEGLKVE